MNRQSKAKCKKCGSKDIKVREEDYDTYNHWCNDGSSITYYKCKKCGYKWKKCGYKWKYEYNRA